MLESHFVKAEKTWFNSLASTVSAVDYLIDHGLEFVAARRIPVWDARRGRNINPPVSL